MGGWGSLKSLIPRQSDVFRAAFRATMGTSLALMLKDFPLSFFKNADSFTDCYLCGLLFVQVGIHGGLFHWVLSLPKKIIQLPKKLFFGKSKKEEEGTEEDDSEDPDVEIGKAKAGTTAWALGHVTRFVYCIFVPNVIINFFLALEARVPGSFIAPCILIIVAGNFGYTLEKGGCFMHA